MNQIIEKIKESIDIVYFIGQYINLKKSGENYISLCPFHNDSSPSFVVSRTKKIATCFGACNTTFDIISFYERYFNVTKCAAISKLVTGTGLFKRKTQLNLSSGIVKTSKFFGSDSEYIYYERYGIALEGGDIPENICHQLALKCLSEFYMQTQQRVYSSLVDYLKKDFDVDAYLYLTGPKRGLNPETIEKFSLCTIKHLKQTIEFIKDNFNSEEIIISGLFNEKGNFVFYKHRILIPYIEDGNIQLIRGRYFFEGNEIPEENSKYKSVVNRTGTISSKRFYNVDTIKGMYPNEKLIVCEGEYDTMILEQEGYKAIGIPGITNIPENQIKLIKDNNIYLAFDNDPSGVKASKEFVGLLKRPVKAIQLKRHKDLTDLINERNRTTL